MKTVLFSAIRSLLSQPLEPILHLSRMRIVTIGLFLTLGHPIFWWVWTHVEPQPYENLPLRLLAAVGGIPFLFITPKSLQENLRLKVYVLVVLCCAGPLLFLWFFRMNEGSAIWMASVCLVCLLSYQIADWRYATCFVLTSLTITAFTGSGEGFQRDGWIIFMFSWVSGLIFGISSANQRIQRIQATLSSMGVMAHELRTPLATAALLTRTLHTSDLDYVRKVGQQLETVFKAMNHQIDTQIVNAQLLRLKAGSERINAVDLVNESVASYPFTSDLDRLSVVRQFRQDFCFLGTNRLFVQVIHNIIRNALVALKRTKGQCSPGDISITVESRNNGGYIIVQDLGPGIDESYRDHIFQPFVSSQTNYSSGLGLSFCKSTVEANNGKIRVESSEHRTRFIIEMPLAS